MAAINSALTLEFAADVRRDLALEPKQIQSKYLYDALGSSLFDAICRLPWYRITRAESRLLSIHADPIVSTIADNDGTIVELGCGSGEKLVLLAEALQAAGGEVKPRAGRVTQGLNEVYASEDSGLDSGLQALQTRSLSREDR